MNDVKKAIETLEDMKGIFDTRGHKQYSLPALGLAISALEKQIPKKVIIDKRSKEELSGKCREFPKCPTCKAAVMGYCDDGFNIPPQAFCWDCGQKIDWSVEE